MRNTQGMWRVPGARGRAAALLALLALGASAALADDVVREANLFEYQGRTYGPADVGPKLGAALHALDTRYHEERSLLVDEALFELYLSAEAARTGESRQDVAARELSVPDPSAAEIERFYAENRLRIDGELEAVRSKIARHLRLEALAARKQALLARLKDEGQFVSALAPPPPPPVSFDLAGFPIRGKPDAPVTVVEFGDYQCPRCRRAVSILQGLVERHPDTVRVVYLDFPVNRSGISRRVAEGAVCAAAQDAFWAYHDLAFERQPQLDEDAPASLARDLGLDMSAFERCAAGPEPRAMVLRAERQARALGIGGTPAIYVNGRPLAADDLSAALEARVQALAAP